MTKLLVELVGSGLLLEETLEKAYKYRLSDKGMLFLKAYIQFEDFAQSYGLKL
jgi:predicted transcriptional regulator